MRFQPLRVRVHKLYELLLERRPGVLSHCRRAVPLGILLQSGRRRVLDLAGLLRRQLHGFRHLPVIFGWGPAIGRKSRIILSGDGSAPVAHSGGGRSTGGGTGNGTGGGSGTGE